MNFQGSLWIFILGCFIKLYCYQWLMMTDLISSRVTLRHQLAELLLADSGFSWVTRLLEFLEVGFDFLLLHARVVCQEGQVSWGEGGGGTAHGQHSTEQLLYVCVRHLAYLQASVVSIHDWNTGETAGFLNSFMKLQLTCAELVNWNLCNKLEYEYEVSNFFYLLIKHLTNKYFVFNKVCLICMHQNSYIQVERMQNPQTK